MSWRDVCDSKTITTKKIKENGTKNKFFNQNTRTKNTTFVSFINTIIWGMRREKERGLGRRRRRTVHGYGGRRREKKNLPKNLVSLSFSHKTSSTFSQKCKVWNKTILPSLGYRSHGWERVNGRENFCFQNILASQASSYAIFKNFQK